VFFGDSESRYLSQGEPHDNIKNLLSFKERVGVCTRWRRRSDSE